MKIRIRDRKLPLKQKTKKFRPLRFKNMVLKWLLFASCAANLSLIYMLLQKS